MLGYGTWANSQGSFGTNSFPYIDFNLYKDVNLYPLSSLLYLFASSKLTALIYPVPPQWPQKLGTGEQAVLYSGVDPAVTGMLKYIFFPPYIVIHLSITLAILF